MPDKHVVKMILEYTQLLCTAYRMMSLDGSSLDELGLYKVTHKNHPCSNYLWLHELLGYVFEEYTYRYQKTHACYRLYDILSKPPKEIPDGPLTPFALAMPDRYRPVGNLKNASGEEAVEAYRRYFIGDKPKLAAWKKRSRPNWWPETVRS